MALICKDTNIRNLLVAGCRLQVAGCRLQVAGCRVQGAGLPHPNPTPKRGRLFSQGRGAG